jgi:hypothetical protein
LYPYQLCPELVKRWPGSRARVPTTVNPWSMLPLVGAFVRGIGDGTGG